MQNVQYITDNRGEGKISEKKESLFVLDKDKNLSVSEREDKKKTKKKRERAE